MKRQFAFLFFLSFLSGAPRPQSVDQNTENGGIFVPNKRASPQASERRACEGGSLKSKNAEKRASSMRARKRAPQFTKRK